MRTKRANPEYLLCREIAAYLRLRWPKVVYHFDLTGLALSRAQAGMTKAIQYGRGFPDLFIAQKGDLIDKGTGLISRNYYSGLFLELKAEGTRLLKKDGSIATPHLVEQYDMINRLRNAGYRAHIVVGYDQAVRIIEEYLK